MIIPGICIFIIEGNPERANILRDYLLKDFDLVKAFPSVHTMLLEHYSHPSIVLLDMNVSDTTGQEDIFLIKRKFTDIQIILMSSLGDSERVFNSICAGASGYLEKESDLPEIKKAIIDLNHGRFPITPEMTRKIFAYLQPAQRVTVCLTNRENDVVQSLMAGLSYKLIASKLNISIDTVRKHIRNIYSKLNINSKGELLSLYRNTYIQ